MLAFRRVHTHCNDEDRGYFGPPPTAKLHGAFEAVIGTEDYVLPLTVGRCNLTTLLFEIVRDGVSWMRTGSLVNEYNNSFHIRTKKKVAGRCFILTNTVEGEQDSKNVVCLVQSQWSVEDGCRLCLWKKSNSEHLVEFLLFANEDTYLLDVLRTSQTRKDIIEACKVTDACDGSNVSWPCMWEIHNKEASKHRDDYFFTEKRKKSYRSTGGRESRFVHCINTTSRQVPLHLMRLLYSTRHCDGYGVGKCVHWSNFNAKSARSTLHSIWSPDDFSEANFNRVSGFQSK